MSDSVDRAGIPRMTRTGFSFDIGDGQGIRPEFRIPRLGDYKINWDFRWNVEGVRGDGVQIELTVNVPGVGVFKHFAHAPFVLKDEPGPVELSVERTEVIWGDFAIGMTQLRLGDQVKQVNAELQSPEMRTHLPFLPDADLATKRRGRRGRRDIEHALLARDYVKLIEQGDRSPNKTLAAEYRTTAKHIAKRIDQCRNKGFLAGSQVGRAGGELTSKAKNVLRESSEVQP